MTTGFFAPPWHWGALAVGSGAAVYILRHRGRANETDGANIGVIENGVDRIAPPFTSCTTPGGKPASSINANSFCVVIGTFSLGFRMKQLPVATA